MNEVDLRQRRYTPTCRIDYTRRAELGGNVILWTVRRRSVQRKTFDSCRVPLKLEPLATCTRRSASSLVIRKTIQSSAFGSPRRCVNDASGRRLRTRATGRTAVPILESLPLGSWIFGSRCSLDPQLEICRSERRGE